MFIRSEYKLKKKSITKPVWVTNFGHHFVINVSELLTANLVCTLTVTT